MTSGHNHRSSTFPWRGLVLVLGFLMNALIPVRAAFAAPPATQPAENDPPLNSHVAVQLDHPYGGTGIKDPPDAIEGKLLRITEKWLIVKRGLDDAVYWISREHIVFVVILNN